jgi:hypothetical protein
MSNIPKDKILYNKIKANIYNKIPKHSAYRSGLIVKEYKKQYFKKYKNNNAYHGVKKEKKGLARWFKEQWKNQRGEIGYKYKNDVYRPTKKITSKTPLTFKELTEKELKKARKEKLSKGRIYKFRSKKEKK